MTYQPHQIPTNLDVEYSQWRLTQEIVKHVIITWGDNKPYVYEFHNAIERMLMSMCNSELRTRLIHPWSIYYHVSKTDPFIHQLYTELSLSLIHI